VAKLGAGPFYAEGHNSTFTPAFSRRRTNSSPILLIRASSPRARTLFSDTATTRPQGHAMDGSFSKYATTSAGDIVGTSVAALIGRASIQFTFTITGSANLAHP